LEQFISLKKELLTGNKKMIMKKTAIISILIAFAFSSCNYFNKKKEQKDVININLREAWFPWAGYAGELVAQYDTDSLSNVNFTVEPGAEDIDPIKMVISGRNDFGIASAENLILSNQKGADLVAIGALNYKSSTCFITLENSNIKSVKDFEGKTVGILTGTETETIYRLLLAMNNLNTKSIKEIEAPYDVKSFITTKEYDVRPAFIYDEPISLDAQGIKYNVIKPENYGVQVMGAVYFTTRKMIKEHPEKVQAFVNVISKGWEKALAEPEYSIGLLKKFDKNIDEARELESLKRGTEYFAGENGKILYVSDSAWIKLSDDLKSLGRVNASFDVSKSFDNSFVNEYHDADKK